MAIPSLIYGATSVAFFNPYGQAKGYAIPKPLISATRRTKGIAIPNLLISATRVAKGTAISSRNS